MSFDNKMIKKTMNIKEYKLLIVLITLTHPLTTVKAVIQRLNTYGI